MHFSQHSHYVNYIYTVMNPKDASFSVGKIMCEPNMNKLELIMALENLMSDWSLFNHHSSILENRIYASATEIARITRRGMGNRLYKNYLFYKGTHPLDGPFFVTKVEDKYGLAVHPKYKKYGFKL